MVDVPMKDTSLSGMKAICDHVKRSESTVLKLIREFDFPATKIGGVWESDAELIAQWRKTMIAHGVGVG